MRYEVFKLITIDGCLLGWLVYGNMIYFSDKNDCRNQESTQGLNEMMLVILIIGYIMMGTYLFILCMIPVVIYYLRNIQDQNNPGRISQARVPAVIQSLSRVSYDP